MAENWVQIQERSGLCSQQDGQLFKTLQDRSEVSMSMFCDDTYMEELFELRILSACRPVPEDHLSGQGVGIQSNDIDELVWLFQQANQHRLVFKILVWHIGLGCCNVQGIVNDLADHAPCLAVFLSHTVNDPFAFAKL